jgi:hypothetical protein
MLVTPHQAWQTLERLVFADAFPAAATLTYPSYDTLLAARETDAFAVPWTRAYERSQAAVSQLVADPRTKARRTAVREHVFKRVYRHTQVADLASYTSDDLDLILGYVLTAMPSPWVNALWLGYKQGIIPSGHLPETSGELTELIGA